MAACMPPGGPGRRRSARCRQSGALDAGALAANDASAGFPHAGLVPSGRGAERVLGRAGILFASTGNGAGAQQGQSRQVLFVNGGTSVWGVDVDVDATAVQSYHLPGSGSTAPYLISGFGYSNGVLWFGDTDATLYGLDAQNMQPVPNTPRDLRPWPIATTPLLYTDARGEAAVLFSVVNGVNQSPGLLVFDPTSGNTISIPTQGTTSSRFADGRQRRRVRGWRNLLRQPPSLRRRCLRSVWIRPCRTCATSSSTRS